MNASRQKHHLSRSPLLVAVVGLCGSGKSEAAEWFVRRGFHSIRFGQLTLDVVKRRGLKPTESNERSIRERLRRMHGPAAFAKLNLPKIRALLRRGHDTLLDGLYSWSEYKVLKRVFGSQLVIIAVYTPPSIRYQRLHHRRGRYREDPHLRFRSFTPNQAAARDKAEIENIEKAGPIAMAEYTIMNTGSLTSFYRSLNKTLQTIQHRRSRR